MSKERELLWTCLEEMQYYEVPCPELINEIKQLLAQPKQLEIRVGVTLNAKNQVTYISNHENINATLAMDLITNVQPESFKPDCVNYEIEGVE